jgi:hypothetical protein
MSPGTMHARLAQRPRLQVLAAARRGNPHSVRAHSAILDGEICCLEPDGTSHFKNLLFRREWPFFMAFDVPTVGGGDLRALRLFQRKRTRGSGSPTSECRLRSAQPLRAPRL